MSDEAFPAPTSSGAMTPTSEGDYDAICAAVMETVRGRWFLSEFSRRNRHADTQLVLVALDRIERGLRGRQTVESVERLRNDLMEMARAIAQAKAEIAGVSPADEGHPIADVSLELDSVVRATNEATSNILAAAAQIQEVAWTMREQGNDDGLSDQLSAYAATIQNAAASQKRAGEQTQKVVEVMRDLEGRINDMIDVWGGYPAVDNRLLANSARTTPALPPADLGQVETDAPTEPQPTASREANRRRDHLNDNGRSSSKGHLVLDPSIAAAIRDAASLTNSAGGEVNAATSAAEVADTSFPSSSTPQHEGSGDGKDADPSKAREPTAAETAAKPDQQSEPPGETQPDGDETRDTQGTSAVELTATPRPFVVIDLDLEPLPIGPDTKAPPNPDTTASAREISGGAREKEASPTVGQPKPSGWLSEPVSALYDLPPLEVNAAAALSSATTLDSGPEGLPARSQSASRWPFAFLGSRSRTKPTALAEVAPTETTAPPPAVAVAPAVTDKTASAPAATAPAVAFELGGPTLVVVAPHTASEPRSLTVAPQPAASERSTPAVATAALPASQPDAPVVAAASAPAASEPSAPVVAAAVQSAASEPVAPLVAAAPSAASDPGGPVAAAGAPAKPATSNVKVLRASPPPPSDPLAALSALSDEEKLALFS